MFTPPGRACVASAMLACVLSLGATCVQARNTRLLMPIEPVLKLDTVQAVLAPDLRLQFGDTLPEGAQVLQQELKIHSKVDTHMGYAGTRPLTRTDAQACREAFRVALVDMALAARKLGATALLRVVSNYDNVEMASPAEYECHAGATRAVVELKAVVARWSPPGNATKPRRAAAASAPASAPAPVAHVLPVPPDSGFASALDADALPLSDKGKERYRHYLTLPAPKAFVVLENGGWHFFWRDANAMTKVLDHCARIQKRCWLYAVDDHVVWVADADKRIATSAQLQARP